MKKLLVDLLPSSEPLIPTATSWFVFPLAQQYLWCCTGCSVTEIKGYFGEGSSFNHFGEVQHGPLNSCFHDTEGEEAAEGQMGDERNFTNQLCCQNPEQWLQATLLMLWYLMVWKNTGYLSAI